MNIVPIAFAFDNNLILPACVCISSLMMNANEDTFYDIFILHSAHMELKKEELDKLPQHYKNCRIQYRLVDETFDNSFEIRGITTPAYYRLLIPELITEYDKVIYSDADIIFRMDLSELYHIDLSSYYLAATKDVWLNFSDDGIKYISSVYGLRKGQYLQSGFIMMNCRKMLQDKLVDKFRNLAKEKLKYQDQDILNLTCCEKVLFLSMKYNMTDNLYYFLNKERDKIASILSGEDICEAMSNGNIHFNGHKPWKKYSINFDIWWEYYRKSPFFDERFYFDHFYYRLNIFDQLSLWKRIKILVRYFVYGKRII
jgi:UDP-glucose:(galactosyl)LPS alpha-1,2-glucosyltransferase